MAEMIMLRLEGLLQSWGEATAWDQRGTANFPTRSAVVGLLACAMGLDREDSEILALSQAIAMGVRADRQGSLLRDYHTVHGMPFIWKANGEKRTDPIVSPHWYLQDASFLVVIQAAEPWRERISQALADPKWRLYLGRKNCVPSRPVWDGIHSEYSTIEEAIRLYPAAERADQTMSYELETACADGNSLTRPDVPVGDRKFDRRSVWRGSIRRDDCVSD